PEPAERARRYRTWRSVVVYRAPASSIVWTQQPSDESSSVAATPPWTEPIGLYIHSAGSIANTTRPGSTSAISNPRSEARGGRWWHGAGWDRADGFDSREFAGGARGCHRVRPAERPRPRLRHATESIASGGGGVPRPR